MSWFVLAGAAAPRVASAQTCAAPAQCTQLNAPVCNAGLCVPCTSNHGVGLLTDCPNAEAPYCQLSDGGGLGGSCTQCGPGAGNSALCDANHPVCLGDGTCGCTTDTQCASGTCDTLAHECVSDDAGASDASTSGDGSASADGSASSNDAGTGEPEDASSGVSGDAEARGDATAIEGGSGERDGGSEDAQASGEDGGGEAGTSGETGAQGKGDYILGGGCHCTAGRGDDPRDVPVVAGLALACVAVLRRRSR